MPGSRLVASPTCRSLPPSPSSGALAGPALLLTGTQQSHTSLSLFVFVRGLTLLVRCGNLPEAHPLKVRRAGRWG